MFNIFACSCGMPFTGNIIKKSIEENIKYYTLDYKKAIELEESSQQLIDEELYCLEFNPNKNKYKIVKFYSENRNCFYCYEKYYKDLNYSDDCCGEDLVCICGKDNHYIGYPEEAKDEVCCFFKREGE